MASRNPIGDQVILMVLYLAIMSIGSSIAVAILFTQPLATFLVLSVYRERLEEQPVIEMEPSVKTPPSSEDDAVGE